MTAINHCPECDMNLEREGEIEHIYEGFGHVNFGSYIALIDGDLYLLAGISCPHCDWHNYTKTILNEIPKQEWEKFSPT